MSISSLNGCPWLITVFHACVMGPGREIQSLNGRPVIEVIQTDAAINPGKHSIFPALATNASFCLGFREVPGVAR